jgi:hypothetical protein
MVLTKPHLQRAVFTGAALSGLVLPALEALAGPATQWALRAPGESRQWNMVGR